MLDFDCRDPDATFAGFANFLRNGTPFRFIRFSDGEMEILSKRDLVLGAPGETFFRGRFLSQNYEDYDKKKFFFQQSSHIFEDVHKAWTFMGSNYFKGIPTKHNRIVYDQRVQIADMISIDERCTFCDIFSNNYLPSFEKLAEEIFRNRRYCLVVNEKSDGKWVHMSRANFLIPNNAFDSWSQLVGDFEIFLERIPEGMQIFASASSFSNIFGYLVQISRPDLTFVDCGTSLNGLIGLSLNTRDFHCLSIYQKKSFANSIKRLKYKLRRHSSLVW